MASASASILLIFTHPAMTPKSSVPMPVTFSGFSNGVAVLCQRLIACSSNDPISAIACNSPPCFPLSRGISTRPRDLRCRLRQVDRGHDRLGRSAITTDPEAVPATSNLRQVSRLFQAGAPTASVGSIAWSQAFFLPSITQNTRPRFRNPGSESKVEMFGEMESDP